MHPVRGNKKHTFLTDKYEIVLEEIKDAGLFLEVEVLNEIKEDKILQEKKKILKFIKSTKIKVSDELNMGKPEIMLRNKKLGD